MLSRRLNLVMLPLLLLVFGISVMKLFELRFNQGDVYAPYSSLRADPVGTKALFKAFDRLEAIECSRLYESIKRLAGGKDTTLFVLGTAPGAFRWVAKDEFRELEQFIYQGGRLVFSLFPHAKRSYWDRRNEKNTIERAKRLRQKYEQKQDDEKERKGDEEDSSPDDKDAFAEEKRNQKHPVPGNFPDTDEDKDFERWIKAFTRVSLFDEWGVQLEWKDLATDEEGLPIPVPARLHSKTESGLSRELTLHTAAVFSLAEDTEWRVVYERDGDPVIIEREFGNGSVVLSADSYWFSNEAMRKDRDLPLLGWFAGKARRVVFDEEHLGVSRSDGVATLGRKYRLHGLIAGLLVLALLFIWKNATTLLPPLADAVTTGAAVTGRESGAGFVNLLRRTVPPATLLSTCVQQWRHTNPHKRKMAAAIESIAMRENKERTPIAVVKKYREICALLKQR